MRRQEQSMSISETFLLYPQEDARDLGPLQLDLHLFANRLNSPAHAVRANMQVVNDGALLSRSLMHPAHAGAFRLAPSLIQVESCQRSMLTLYTFGADAECDSDCMLSNIHLHSAAPLILIGKSLFDNDLNPVDLVVNGFQAWLSILRARSARDLSAFYRQLQLVSPFSLYLQALMLAAHTLDSVPVDDRSERFYRSRRVIQAALAAAQKRPGADHALPTLEAILSPRGSF
jgi:hypothetical protein